MDSVMRGEATSAKIGGFLIALRLKGETADEIAGVRRGDAARTSCPAAPSAPTSSTRRAPAATVRTPLNISTAAALVAAAAGAAVAKHGQPCGLVLVGSADVLEALGFELELAPERSRARSTSSASGSCSRRRTIPRCGTRARSPRAGTRTVFNVLGPLTNPAGARRQVVGVYAPELVRTLADVLARLGARRAFVVHGAAGIDELSPGRPEPRRRGRRRRRARADDRPARARRPALRPGELVGGTPAENARAIRAIFEGARTAAPERDPPERRGRDRGGGHARTCARARLRARGARLRRGRRAARRARRVLAARGRSVRFRDALAARARRDRRDQAALAVRGRPARRRRPGALAARSSARAAALSVLVDDALRRLARRPARRARAATAAAARQGLLHGGARPRELQGRGRDAALILLRDVDDARARALMREPASSGSTRSSRRTTRTSSSARRARRRPDRRQRARPRELRDRPARAARARRAAPRDRVVVAESGVHSRAQAPRPSSRARTRPRRHGAHAAPTRREAAELLAARS
jgi:anthranilate phosphoribosyltransferase